MNDNIVTLKKQIDSLSLKLLDFQRQRINHEDVYSLLKERRSLQRKLSMAQNEETAMLLDYPYPCDIGAPLPHVISDGNRTFLIYYINEHHPKWSAADKKIIDLNSGHNDMTALVEFINCYNYKFGGINDEVISGHPLYSHGLEAYEAHEMIHSKWLDEEEKINSIHSNYSHAVWEKRKHYIFTFHDEIFECIAEGYRVEIFKGRIRSVFLEATKRLFE